MQQVYSFIDVLYEHTVGNIFSLLQGILSNPTVVSRVEPVVPHVESEIEADAGEAPQTFKALGSIIEERVVDENRVHTIAYVGSTRMPIFNAPTKEFDTVGMTILYGTMVMVLEEKGRFSKIAVNGVEGWVLRDDLADRAAYVYPQFAIGEENDFDAPNTLRVRACIKDEFCGGEAEFPLQAGEYVLYKLIRKGKSIHWPAVRPRTPGRWHTILRGVPNVHIGIAPKGGSIMECTLTHDMGHLAYVEAVFPDERITISEANFPDRGTYNERTLTKEEWQALNPVFIEV